MRGQESIEQVISRRGEKSLIRRGYAALFIRIIVIALAFYFVLTYVFLICQCSGQAMFPALKDGDLCVIFRKETADLLGEKISAGDVIAYRKENVRHFGRVVALEGDMLQMDSNGSVTVNGVTESDEILFPTYPRDGELLSLSYVPQGSLYVLGDYRTRTEDSRDFGAIPLEDVDGKVISILRRRGL